MLIFSSGESFNLISRVVLRGSHNSSTFKLVAIRIGRNGLEEE